MTTFKNFIGGEWVEPSTGDYFDNRNPADTNDLIGRFPTGRQATRVPGILVFIYVNNLQQAILNATQHGGETVKQPYAEGDVRVATIRDPSGNSWRLVQPSPVPVS